MLLTGLAVLISKNLLKTGKNVQRALSTLNDSRLKPSGINSSRSMSHICILGVFSLL